jgi:hypothetical protein
MSEALTQAAPLDPSSRALMIRLWLKTLGEIGEERFDEALTQALESSTFRPTIAEIRRYASAPSEPPFEVEADREFTKLIRLLRHHGRKLTNRGDPPKDPPGPLADVTMRTISDMGRGSIAAGLEAIWAHPALDKVRPPAELDELESFRAVAGEKIERKWVKLYTKLKAEALKGGEV